MGECLQKKMKEVAPMVSSGWEFFILSYKEKNLLVKETELKTLEWWISRLMLNLLFFLISRLI